MEHSADALTRHAVARLTDFSAYSAKSVTIGAGIGSALFAARETAQIRQV
jgi:ubiquinone biosynthesis protein COQ9